MIYTLLKLIINLRNASKMIVKIWVKYTTFDETFDLVLKYFWKQKMYSILFHVLLDLKNMFEMCVCVSCSSD